jgi:hypothetical protein
MGASSSKGRARPSFGIVVLQGALRDDGDRGIESRDRTRWRPPATKVIVICPDCGRPSLEMLSILELGPDGYNDETTLHTLVCWSCAAVGVATYEECRRGSLDRERSEFGACRVALDEFARVERMLRACPAPRDWRCGCATHAYFRAGSESGSLKPLAKVQILEPLPVEP